MKKQILSAAMALSMLTMQLPMTSFAQGATMTEEDLIAALEQAQDGATVELTGSVELTGQLVMKSRSFWTETAIRFPRERARMCSPTTPGFW